MKKEDLEKNAEIAHNIWSHWMKYFLDDNKEFTFEDYDRWAIQMETPYKDLTEKEKQSDRKVAKLYIK